MSGIQSTRAASAIEQQTPRYVTSDTLKEFESITKPVLPAGTEEGAPPSYESLTEEQKDKLAEDMEEANEALKPYNKELKFEYNEEAEMMQVSVIDRRTNEVVANLPPEFLVELSEKMNDMIGMFIDEKV
ncbi:flagellar protein FlaG [Cohnella fermenti]|uniref:Flagellar protein n=1 Tax=Cohnella fermenti TaxID=2565925 RepID=A0A4S4BZU2_9BACL|nr:flagellar protein FlaG [Cohnella fermenti]THF80805.1 flagellar protein [Cohnella fermenti]